jgi:chromate reductase, NAD(P)H dehydrogenase (quinone)
VLKNAIDWASRPPRVAVLDRKPLALMGASRGMTGSARGQSQLRRAFVFTNSYALPQPEMLVAHAQEKFDDQGRLTDEKTRDFLGKLLGALAEWAMRFRAVSAG